MQISGNIVNIAEKRIFGGTLTYENGRITSVEEDGRTYDTYILPPFIDAHVHVESSMLIPTEFARLAAVHGTGATVSDPHEIANVLGVEGVYFMLDNAAKTPFRFFFGAPSCVPATPFETAGGRLDTDDIKALLADDRIKYLSEMMNVPGVINGDGEVTAKIKATLCAGKPVDGHAPVLTGDSLRAYVSAGITADHEAISYAEGLEKIKLGMKIQIREGSAAKNFEALYPLLSEYPDMCMLCSDDLHPDDLAKGHINLLVKRAVEHGIDLFSVLTAACVTPVKHYNLNCGLLNVGDSADFIIVDNLTDMNVTETYIKGVLCAESGNPLLESVREEHPNIFNATEKHTADFSVPAREITDVIIVEDGQLVTGHGKEAPKVINGRCVSDTDRDIIKIAVINRYEDAAPAVAFIKNFGLKRGAVASSVAHDSHNIICVGCTDDEMAQAVNLIIKNGGGLSAVDGARSLTLPLPVAGIMTDADGYDTAKTYEELQNMAQEMGSELQAPYMTLSFMALLVIPSLKLSDKGLFDGDNFRFI